MAVARKHGKVKCRPLKEKKEEGTVYKARHDGLFVSRCPSFTDLQCLFLPGCAVLKSARKRGGQTKLSGFPFSFLPPGNTLQWSAVFKGLNLSE